MVYEFRKSIPSGVLEAASVYSSASPSYRLPDTFQQTQLPITVLVMILSAVSDKNPNSNQLKRRKKNLFAHKTKESKLQV